MKKKRVTSRLVIPIFIKMLSGFVLVAAIGFVVSGVVFYRQMADYVYDQKVNVLKNAVVNVSESMEDYFILYSYGRDEIIEKAWNNLNTIIQRECIHIGDAHIWVIDTDGYVRIAYPAISDNAKLRYETDRDGSMKLSSDMLALFNSEDSEYSFTKGDFCGFFNLEEYRKEYGSKEWVTIGQTVTYTSNLYDSQATIIIHIPLNVMRNSTFPIAKMYTVSFLSAMIIATILAFALSRSLSVPLRKLNRAASKIAKGDFGSSIEIYNRDEIGELTESFNHMVQSLKDIEKMRSGFISNVSHELRTPMTSILGFIEGILDGTIPADKQMYYLGIVRDEVERLSQMVSNLLELSKMEAGQVRLEKENCNLSELCRICLINLGALFDNKNISVEAELGEEDFCAYCDKEAIRRVLINILHNAIKFTPENGTIGISVRESKEKLVVSIQDSGSGIPEDELPHIWERFYKVDKSRGINKNGTGLGLSIVKNIINEHKETVWARNCPEGGAIFEFTLTKAKQGKADFKAIETDQSRISQN